VSKHHGGKTWGGGEVYLHEIFISTLDAGELSDSRSGHFIPGKLDRGCTDVVAIIESRSLKL
jgi:hypothetical protein